MERANIFNQWRMESGQYILIKDMSSAHIKNTINMIQRELPYKTRDAILEVGSDSILGSFKETLLSFYIEELKQDLLYEYIEGLKEELAKREFRR